MNCTRKEINEMMFRLISVTLDNEIIDQKAGIMRNELQNLYENLHQGISSLYVQLTNLYVYTVEYEKNSNLLSGNLASLSPNNQNEVLNVLKKTQDENISSFLKSYSTLIKKINSNLDNIAQSNFPELYDELFAKKKKMIEQHLDFIKNSLLKVLQDVSNELANASVKLDSYLDVNPFEFAVQTLPKKLALDNLAEAKPELAAVELSYQGTISALKGLSSITKFMEAVDKHHELLQRKDEAERLVQRAYQEYKQMTEELDHIINLNAIVLGMKFFNNYAEPQFIFFNDNYNKFKEAVADNNLEALISQMKDLKLFIDEKELVWH